MLKFGKGQQVMNVIGGMKAWLSLGYSMVTEEEED
jgi:rhodanese-related sulfurtransferase